MEDQDQELIEQYYNNALSKAELVEFHHRLTSDAAFHEAVQLHEDALAAIRLGGTATLRARLAAKGRELDAGTHKLGSRWSWWVVGAVAVLLGAWAVWERMPSENSPAPKPVIETRDIAAPQATDTLPTVPPPQKQTEPAQKTPSHQRVFAAWFQPYKDPSLEPARRGDAERSPSERFQQLYWDGDYRAALVAFDSLGTFAKNNDNLLFLKANCLLATGQFADAGELLEQLRLHDRSRFSAQCDWYLALTRLQTGRIKDAETLLRRIVADPGSPRRTDAEQLLRDLK